LPDPSVRVKRNVFSHLNPFRLTRTPVPQGAARIEKIELPEDFRDRGVYVPTGYRVNQRAGNDYNS
jgi:hypothetical protein